MNKIIFLLGLALIQIQSFAQVDALLIQYPDVSENQICFTYGDDLWLVDKKGGDAFKLSSPVGRETNPKFSPDGKSIAFQANYDGNYDIYTLPVRGGVPKRVTGHGMSENIKDWYKDGQSILYTSSMESGKQRWSQFYKISAKGGLPEKLPIEMGEMGSLSPDGNQIAFTDKTRVFRTWKRYRGGTAPDIFVMNLATKSCENITNNNANDELPMWHQDRIYYMSDRGPNLRNNLWVYDTKTKTHEQLTNFKDNDIHWPSLGPKEIVFEAEGKIHLLDLNDHSTKVVKINAIGDFTGIKPVRKSVANNIASYNISPDGNRAVIEARGDIFTLPKENGAVRNITASSGVGERHPAWSPDGSKIAYFSDRSGEYELTIRDMETGTESQISNMGAGFRYHLYWSPDSKKVVFVDQTMTIYMIDINTKVKTKIDKDHYLYEGGLRGFEVSWSSDSQWIAYTKATESRNSAIFIYNTKTAKSTQVTSGFYDDLNVTFDPDGEYLYAMSNREFNPVYSDYDNTWIYPNATQIVAFSLRDDVPSPLAPKTDEVSITKKDDSKKEDEKDEKDEDKEDKADEKEEEKTVEIDFDGFERRMTVLPIPTGNFGNMKAISGKIVYVKTSNSGSASNDVKLMYYDIKEQESKMIASDVWGFKISADGNSVLVSSNGQYAILKIAPEQKLENKLAIKDMKSTINPREEWTQIFNDVWRLERDFFYDKNMHGVDWDQLKIRYGRMIENAVSRYDVNMIIGELIGELNASHTYRGGGDMNYGSFENVGYLGIDWEKSNGLFKVKRIVRGADWDHEVKSPLDEPGIDVNEGDYIFEVNGVPLTEFSDPWMAFAGTAGKTVEIKTGKTNNLSEAKNILVTPLRSETRLRNLEWIENNRKYVDKISGGKIGYIYVPSTGLDGQHELVRMFYAQHEKEGLIIDERFNNGGQIPDRFVELLNRKPLAYFNVRDGKEWKFPPIAHFGPKAMLINGWSGSGGDAFPDYFRKSGLGPLIGTRTWGGLIGISGCPSLIDGGGVTVPTFRMYDPDGAWFPEGYGVDPDVEVKEDPSALSKGNDTQLDAAIQRVLKDLETSFKHPKIPSKEKR